MYVAKCSLAMKGDTFTEGREYVINEDDTMADDDGVLHYAMVAITGAACSNSFFTILGAK